METYPTTPVVPSDTDRGLTDRMIKAGQMLRIEVIDHLIISEETFFSFADQHIMDELKNTGNYVLMEREKMALTNLKITIVKEAAEKQNNFYRALPAGIPVSS